MKRLTIASAALALSGCVMPGMPGMNPMGAMGDATMSNSMAQAESQQANLLAAQASAEAGAARPGDDAKSCDALQAEMGTTLNDPKVQSAIASMGASAQSQMDRAKGAQAAATAGVATSMAAGIAGSFIPGLNWFSQGAMMAQQSAAVSQMEAANRDRGQMITDLTSVLPQLYRGQHLYDISVRKNCAFTKQPA